VIRPFRRGFSIGLVGQILVFLLMIGGLYLAIQFGGPGGGTAAALSFLPALILVSLLFLLVLLIVIAIPPLRHRAGAWWALLLGWLTGGALVTGVIAVIWVATD